MKNEEIKNDYRVTFTELNPQIQIENPNFSELYKKAYLENDTGVVSNEFCMNTTVWD